ncbi:putative membrane protein [Pseudaminobacter salicylatoxidans]|uniref:Putative membrane protein n=1 Tax=Pseudaminobacter salicylatoxidans TaxID=93369 RepID=A0A316C4M6_PSESE|nr:AzlD family protein [Pseudaminobacter salicylatoxidans]PWJ83946.1 putative membrane protein [Pseudaminobacter salicylatoxidans]
MSATFWIIIAGAVATYLTRVGGHLVISRFERIHPRVEAGLNAVPAAVLTTLVAPAMLDAGPAEWAAIVVAGLVALRGGLLSMFLAGAVVLSVARQFMA